MISNISGDERGKLRGGKAGDQTGKEWRIRSWYNRPWNVVLRFENPEVADTIALLSEEGAHNNLIGYDQGDRLSFWKELSKVGYHPKDIKVACETDCSCGALTICKATGFLLGIRKMEAIPVNGYSGNIRPILKNAGAKVLTAKKYLTSDDYLLRGDILVYEGHHVAINLTDGKYAHRDSSPTHHDKEGYTGTFPSLSNGRGWYEYGDGTITLTNYPTQIKRIQKLVNWINGGDIAVDGEYGRDTENAVKKAQKILGVAITGKFDKQTLDAARKYKK